MKKKIEVTDEFLSKNGYTRESYEKLSRSGKWGVRNREKQRAAFRATIAKNPDRHSKRHRWYCLKQNYNITEEDYNNLFNLQNGCCAICGTDKPTGKGNFLAVDHDHKTRKIRGLLCNECNRGIGYLKDNYELVQKAADYLLKTK